MVIIFNSEDREARWQEIFATNADKNYMTALELAALLENNVTYPTYESAVDFLLNLGVYVVTAEARQAVNHALRLYEASFDRAFLESPAKSS